jgi:hypothetical protein
VLFFAGFGMFAIKRYCCNPPHKPTLDTQER